LVITNTAKPTTLTGLGGLGQLVLPLMFVTTGTVTSCGLLGSSTSTRPPFVKLKIEVVGSQVVMRVFRPDAVLPLLLPVLVGIWSPTLIGQSISPDGSKLPPIWCE
jgi:hypothetical protein